MRSIISKMSHSCTILNCNTDKISQQARKEEETEPVSAEEEKAGQIEIHFINAANVLLCQLKLNVTTTFLMYRTVQRYKMKSIYNKIYNRTTPTKTYVPDSETFFFQSGPKRPYEQRSKNLVNCINGRYFQYSLSIFAKLSIQTSVHYTLISFHNLSFCMLIYHPGIK